MTMRILLMGILVAGVTQVVAAPANADRLQFKLHTGSDKNHVGVIQVDGPHGGPYKEIRTKTLDYLISVRGDRPDRATAGLMQVRVGNGQAAEGSLSEQWTNYKLTMPYENLPSAEIANEKVSPITVCNDRLNHTNGAAHGQFLKTGAVIQYPKAYWLQGWVEWIIDKRVGFDEIKRYSEEMQVPVRIECMALDRPRASKDTSTTGAPGPKGKPLPPTISKATFRIEPAKVVQDGKFLCPLELKLYGHVETAREFYGKALFVGPHYLSAITTLNLQGKGSRNVTATYEMNWHPMGGFTTQPNAAPAIQKLTFHFNVADKDGKLLKSVAETIDVSCKKIKVAVPTVGDEMTVKPAN